MIVSASLHQVASTGRRALQTPMETPCVVPANPGSPCLSSEKPATSSLSTQVCSCTHLNAGGLGSDVYQELTTYARDTRLDICHIQETEWPEDGCWSTADYHFVHSAGKNKLDKGRLLHVRNTAGKVPVDLVNIYQFSSNDKPETAEHRHQLLLQLQRCLSGLPKRHALILSGDFNCAPLCRRCGGGTLHGLGQSSSPQGGSGTPCSHSGLEIMYH